MPALSGDRVEIDAESRPSEIVATNGPCVGIEWRARWRLFGEVDAES